MPRSTSNPYRRRPQSMSTPGRAVVQVTSSRERDDLSVEDQMNLHRIRLERKRLKAQSSRIPLGTHDCIDCTHLTFDQLQQIVWKLSNRMKPEQVAGSLGVPTSCVEAIDSTMPRKR